MEKKEDTISRVRTLLKGSSSDTFLTDSFLYSMALKYAKLFIKRLDDSNKLARYNGLFEPLSLELIEVSKVEASCADIKTCCTVRRTKDRLPKLLNGSFGPILRTVSSVDGSKNVTKTYSAQWARMAKSTTFKYNKTLYWWWTDGYAYFPNIEWEEALFDGMWEDNIENYKCCSDHCCVNRLEEETHIPDFLFVEIEGPLRQELIGMAQLPSDKFTDNQNILRS